jgi:hypothetical protein
MRAADRPLRSNATPPKFTRCGDPLGLAAANRVTAGRKSLPNTAHLPPEAPMTASAVAGASTREIPEPGANELRLNPSSMSGVSSRGSEPFSLRTLSGGGIVV